jgi:hypothetical protein
MAGQVLRQGLSATSPRALFLGKVGRRFGMTESQALIRGEKQPQILRLVATANRSE